MCSSDLLYPHTLRDLMKRRIPHQRILPHFAQVLDGVEAAHLKGVWHRDLKPENILCDTESDTLVVADFGIAHFEEDELHAAVETQAHERLANFQYAAPEQHVRGKTVDHRADIYALGLILNEMFTGELPQGTGYRTVVSVAPDYAYLDELVELMVRQSDERPQTINEIKTALIARQNEFVSRQKLSELRNTVVPESEVEDPLVSNPIQLLAVDYRAGVLEFTLSRGINPIWAQAFRNPSECQFILGKEPNRFELEGNKARINAREDQAEIQTLVNYFNIYLNKANKSYATQVQEAHRKKINAERGRIRATLEEEERRNRILRNIKL